MKNIFAIAILAAVLFAGCTQPPVQSPSVTPSVLATPTVQASPTPAASTTPTPSLVADYGDWELYITFGYSLAGTMEMPVPGDYESPKGKRVYSCRVLKDGSRSCCVYPWAGDMQRFRRPLECDLLENYLFGDEEDAFACYPMPDKNGNCPEHALYHTNCRFSHIEQTPIFDIPSGEKKEETKIFVCDDGRSMRDGPRCTTCMAASPNPTVSISPSPSPSAQPSPGGSQVTLPLAGTVNT